MVNIEDFHQSLLNIDKKLHQEIDIYYICYVTIKEFIDYEIIDRVNPLYLTIRCATREFKEKKW